MPTNQNAYNSRVTDESLEKKFRDTFKSQGGAELVDDLYASGVIVPVVDFSRAAEGSVLPTNLQTAWDFSTGFSRIATATRTTIINNTGFWQVDLTYTGIVSSSGGVAVADLSIFDGATDKTIWDMANYVIGTNFFSTTLEDKFVVFLRAGDSLRGRAQNSNANLSVWYRQIADVNGNLTNPLGFTSS